MNPTAQALARAHRAALLLPEAGPASESQQTFMQHLIRSAAQLLKQCEEIPDTQAALFEILPTLGEAFTQQQVALYGYARLMLEQPQAFEGAPLNDAQCEHLHTISSASQEAIRLTDEIMQAAQQWRQRARSAAPARFALGPLLEERLPIWRYWLRERPVILSSTVADELPLVFGSAYHLAEMLRHVVLTMGREWIEYGQIQISASAQARIVALGIFCTGAQGSQDEMARLFGQPGQQLYLAQMRRVKIGLRLEKEPGKGVTILLEIPTGPGQEMRAGL